MDSMIRRLLLTIVLLGASGLAYAMGMGELVVHSKLDEPLSAEIDILLDDSNVNGDISANLATARDFARVGLEKSEIHDQLVFLVERMDGSARILISTDQDISDPFLTFLVELQWEGGRMLKEFTMLLDPPAYTTPVLRQAPVASRDEQEPAPVEIETLPEPEPAMAEPTPVVEEPEPVAEPEIMAEPEPEPEILEEPEPVEPEPEVADFSTGASEYGPVMAGDSLWQIANESRITDRVSINQMMLAIFEANPEAFYQDNINALKKGAILTIPSEDEVMAYSQSTAMALAREQHAAWESFRYNTSVAAEPVSDSSSLSAAVDYYSSSADTTPEDRLEIMPADSDTSSSGGISGVNQDATDEMSASSNDEIMRLKEESATVQSENSQLKTEIQDMENLVDNLERALNLKDADIAELQAQLQDLRQLTEDLQSELANRESTSPAMPETVAEEVSEPEVVEPEVTEPVREDEFSMTDMSEDNVGGNEQLEEPVAVTETVTEPEPVETAPVEPASSDPFATPQAKEPSLMDQLMNPFVLGGAGLAIILVIVVLMFIRRRGGDEEDSFTADDLIEDDEMSPEDELAAALAAEAGEDTDEAADQSEAEQSEEESVADEMPSMEEDDEDDLDLDLSDIYEDEDSIADDALPDLADDSEEDLLDDLGGLDDLEDDDLDLDLPADDETVDSLGEADSTESDDLALDLAELDNAMSGDEDELSLDLDDTSAGADSDGLDLDDMGSLDISDSDEEESTSLDLDDLDDLGDLPDLELDEGESEIDLSSDNLMGDEDSVSTKLDLARAYIDMEDSESARSMLQEVIAEGNDDQKKEGQQLLDKLP